MSPSKPRTLGRRFFLPPGYSLGVRGAGRGAAFVWTKPSAESATPFSDPEEAAGAAWDDARLPRPARLSEAC